MKDDSISYSLEGRFLPTDHLQGSTKSTQSIQMVLSAPFSLAIVEAKKPCTPCFDMALDRLSTYEWVYNNNRVSLVIISHRAHELKKRVALLPLSTPKVLLDDPAGEIHSKLSLPEELTIAILLNGQGKILCARVVKSQSPHTFDHFLSRVHRIIS